MTPVFILAVLLRVVWINVPPLWYDENFTLILARLPWDRMIDATVGDVHPPLWYVIVWAVYHILPNAPAWVIRVPSLLASVAALWLFAQIMPRLGISPRVARAALVLMAVLPMQIWYAQEGRMYAMLECLVLLALYAALERRMVLLFVASLALLYIQNYGAFYLAAIALVVIVREPWRVWRWHIGAMFAAGVLWLPWVYVVVMQMREIEGRYWILDRSLGQVLQILHKLFFASSVPDAFFVASYVVAFAVLIAGTVAVARSSHPARWPVLTMAFAPLLIAWGLSWVWQPVLLFRALIGISPFLYIVAAWPLEEINGNSITQ